MLHARPIRRLGLGLLLSPKLFTPALLHSPDAFLFGFEVGFPPTVGADTLHQSDVGSTTVAHALAIAESKEVLRARRRQRVASLGQDRAYRHHRDTSQHDRQKPCSIAAPGAQFANLVPC